MSLGYHLKEGFSGFKRARLAAVTSIIAMTLSVLLISILVRFAYNGYVVAQAMKENIEVEVFLEDVQEMRQFTIQRILETDPVVKSVSYISKDSAAKIFTASFGSEGNALADLQFLPASYKVRVKEDMTAAQISASIKKWSVLEGIDEITFNSQLLELLEDRLQTLVSIGIAIGILILATALILVFNTIRLTIFAKRDIIRAMKLIGATNSFIRRPFLVEGILQGIVASGVAVALHVALFTNAIPKYIPQLGILSWPMGRWYFLVGAVTFLAIIMGWWGSAWASSRFIQATKISE